MCHFYVLHLHCKFAIQNSLLIFSGNHLYSKTSRQNRREACRIENFPDDLSRENSLFHFLPNWAAEGSALQAHHSGSRFHDIHFARFSQRRFWIASFV